MVRLADIQGDMAASEEIAVDTLVPEDIGVDTGNNDLSAEDLGLMNDYIIDEQANEGDTDYRTKQQKARDSLMYTLPNVLVGGISEVAESMPFIEKEDVEKTLINNLPENMRLDYKQSQLGYETAGAIGMSFIPILGMQKVMRSASLYNKLEKVLGSKATKFILPTKATTVDRMNEFKQKASVMAQKQVNSYTAETAKEINKLMKTNTYAEALDMFKIGVGTDLAIYGMLNENEVFFPDEMSAIETMAMYGVPNVIFSGAVGAATRYKLKNVLRDLGPTVSRFRNPAGLPLQQVVSQEGTRDIAASVYSYQTSLKQAELSVSNPADTILNQNINSQINTYRKKFMVEAEKLAEDKPLKWLNTKHTLTAAEKKTISDARENNPGLLFDTIAIEPYSKADYKMIMTKYDAKIKSVENKIKNLTDELKTKASLTSDQRKEIIRERRKFRKELDEIAKLNFIKINTDGTMSLAGQVRDKFSELSSKFKVKSVNLANANQAIPKAAYGQVYRLQSPIDNKMIGFGAKLKDKQEAAILGEGYKAYIARGNTRIKVTQEVVNDMTFDDLSVFQDLAMKSRGLILGGKKPINLSKQSTFVEIDPILQLIKEDPSDINGVLSRVKIEGVDVVTPDILEFMSINSKYKTFGKKLERVGKQVIAGLKLPVSEMKTMEDLTVELNLPRGAYGGLHPLTEYFMDLQKAGVNSLTSEVKDMKSLKDKVLQSVNYRGDMDQALALQERNLRLFGSQIEKEMADKSPVMLVTKDSGVDLFQREALIEAALTNRSNVIRKLKTSTRVGGDLVAAIAKVALQDKDRFLTGTQVGALINDSQLRTDKFVQAMDGVKNNPIIIAIDSINRDVSNVTKGYIKKSFEPYIDDFQQILSANKRADLDQFAITAHQLGRGYEVKAEPSPVINGGKITGYQYELLPTNKNYMLLKENYGMEFEEIKQIDGMPLPAPVFGKESKFTPLVVSELAAKNLNAINELSQRGYRNFNALLRAANKPTKTPKEFHLTAKDISDKARIPLVNLETNKVYAISTGNTPVQANRIAEEEIAQAKAKGINLVKVTEKDIQNYNYLGLNPEVKILDYSTSFAQTGTAKGTSYGGIVETGKEVLLRMQKSIINQYEMIGKMTMAQLLEPEIRQAEISAISSGLSNATLKSKDTIWDIWRRRALGEKSLNKEKSIGKIYGVVEDLFDKTLQKIWDNKITLLKGGQSQTVANKNYNKLKEAIPDYNPFKDSYEYLTNTMEIKPPHNMQRYVSRMNSITGAALLRMFDTGLAVVNMISLPTLIPVVAGALKRRPGEDFNTWKKTIAAWSSPIDENVAIWNPTRAAITGTQYFFSKEGREILKEASEKGHLFQKAVEQMQLFSEPSKNYWERMLTKGVDFVSKPVDKTEEWSRGISYLIFYKMGKDNLQLKKKAAMEFANHMANKVIGDFRPNNRPQVFQGAVGMPFGLFTTFAWNYMQRVFGYVEESKFRDFFRQMGLQATFFGAKSLPGFNQYNELLTSNYDGDRNLVDRLQEAFGTEGTDALLFGSVGNLTNVAAWTKTDIRLPLSNLNQNPSVFDLMPAASLVKQVYQGVSDTIGSLKANGGVNERQLMEIASKNFPIKNLKGYIEMLNGYSVDMRGQVLSDELNSIPAMAAKAMGTRTIREQLLMEESARQRTIDLKRANARLQFKKGMRALLRDKTLDQDSFDGLVEQYGKTTNGDFSNFKNVLLEQIEYGLLDKGTLKLINDAATASSINGMLRMINIVTNEDYD